MADRALGPDRRRVGLACALHCGHGGEPLARPELPGEPARRRTHVGRVGARRGGCARPGRRRPARRCPRGVQERCRPGPGIGRSPGDPVSGERAGAPALGRAGPDRRRDEVAVLPRRAWRDAVRRVAGAAQPGSRGARRAALRVRATGRWPLLALHLRPARRRGDQRRDTHSADRPVPGAVRGCPRRRGGEQRSTVQLCCARAGPA